MYSPRANQNSTDYLKMSHEKPVVLFFYLPWQGMAFVMVKYFETLKTQYGEDLKFIKLEESNANAPTFNKFGIGKSPTMVFLKDGEVMYALEGIHGKTAIEQRIKMILQ